jgi:tellurite resistance protein TehA-like permease
MVVVANDESELQAMPQNGNANGADRDSERNSSVIDSKNPLRRSVFRAMVQDFGPIWFTWLVIPPGAKPPLHTQHHIYEIIIFPTRRLIANLFLSKHRCMNAGIISTLLHQFPYQFRGVQVLSTIGFVLDLTLFTIFSTIFILRFVLYRGRALAEIVSNIPELCLLPAWSIGFMTLISLVSLTISNASWGGEAWSLLAVAMWWIAFVWMFGMLFFCFVTLVRERSLLDRQLPTLIIIPAVGVATLAVAGGVVSNYAYNLSANLAVPIIITSFCAAGVGLILGLILYTYLFHQLLAHGWPAAAQTPSIFILVGPMGQTAAALLLLGAAANTRGRFAEYNQGTLLTAEAAAPLEVACQLLALLMTGLGGVWLILSLCAMVDRAWHRELAWTPAWNAIIFPTGTLATSTLVFGAEMDSPFFRVITAILTLFLVIVFFINIFFSVWKTFRGELLIVREDPRVKKQMEVRKET